MSRTSTCWRLTLILARMNGGTFILRENGERWNSSSSFLWTSFDCVVYANMQMLCLEGRCPRVPSLLFAKTIMLTLGMSATRPFFPNFGTNLEFSSRWKMYQTAHLRLNYWKLQTRYLHKGHQFVQSSIWYSQFVVPVFCRSLFGRGGLLYMI